MKRFWMTAFLLIGLFAVMVAPVAAKSGDENGSDQESMDALKDDVNSGLGSLASRVSTIEKALEIKFFGDVRGRYAFQSQSQSDPTDAAALNTGVTTISDNIKGRYRARFGVKKETGDIMGGMRISTGQIGVNGATAGNSVLQSNPNSENQTFSNGFGDPGIIIDQAYLTYEPSFLDKHLKVTVGKMPNPLTATPMTWDPDITPEGWMLELSKDEFKFRATYFDLVNNAGAALTSFGGFLNTRAADDEYMANFQMSRMFQFDKDTSATLTAGYEYIPNGTALVGGALNGFFLGPKGAISTTNKPLTAGNIMDFGGVLPDFCVAEGILEVKHQLGDVPVKWTAHFIDNLDSFNVPFTATTAATGPTGTKAVAGYSTWTNQYGFYLEGKFGNVKQKGDWSATLAASYVEPNAQLANLASDDANFTNTEYLFQQVSYGLEDNFSLLLSAWELQRIYYDQYGNPASLANNKLITGGGTSQNPELQVFMDGVLSL